MTMLSTGLIDALVNGEQFHIFTHTRRKKSAALEMQEIQTGAIFYIWSMCTYSDPSIQLSGMTTLKTACIHPYVYKN